MKKQIIVPTDFSENAIKAAKFAISLAAEFDMGILIIHAYYPFRSGLQSPKTNLEDEERTREEAESEMQKFTEKINYSGSKVVVESACHQGNLLNIINDLSDKIPNSIIIMGTTGATGLRYSLIGSNTLHIAKNTSIPLIAVPNGVEDYEINKIALFTDYNERDKKTLADLISFFGVKNVSFSLIHIHDSKLPAGQEHFDKLKNWAEELQSVCGMEPLAWELVEGKEATAIVNEIAERNDINLLALTMADQNFWDRLFEKSFAKAIILQSKSPVFIQH